MKNILIALVLLFGLVSCDSPKVVKIDQIGKTISSRAIPGGFIVGLWGKDE